MRPDASQAADLLERRYRRWLLAYPAGFRRERGDELIGTLLDLADTGRARPHPGEVFAMIRTGTARRWTDAWGRLPRHRLLSLGALLAALAAAYLLLLTEPDTLVCPAFSSPADPAPTICPGPPAVLDLVLSPLARDAVIGMVLLAAVSVLLRGRALAVAALLLTALAVPWPPSIALVLLPSVLLSWLAAAVAGGWLAGRWPSGWRGHGGPVAG